MSSNANPDHEKKPGDHETTYFVDNEPQSTTEKELTVKTILENAGYDPAKHYVIELRGDQQIQHKDVNESIKIHEKMKFAAIFTGETPVS